MLSTVIVNKVSCNMLYSMMLPFIYTAQHHSIQCFRRYCLTSSTLQTQLLEYIVLSEKCVLTFVSTCQVT